MASTPGSALISANSGALDRALISILDNIFTGTSVTKHAPMNREYVRFKAENTIAYVTPQRYKFGRIADFVGVPILEISTQAATSTSATGTHPRFCDWYGIYFVDVIRLKYASQDLQVIEGDDLYIHYILHTPSDNSYAQVLGGGLSAADRNTRATTNGQIHLLPLFLCFWASRTADYLPINSEMLREEMQLNLTSRSVYQLVETDGTDLAQTLNSLDIITEIVHVGDEVQQLMLDEAEAVNPDSGVVGYTRLVTVHNHQKENVAASTNEQPFSITGLANATKELNFFVRNDSVVPSATAVGTGFDWTSFATVSTHNISGFSNTINLAQTDEFNRYIERNRFHTGPIGSEALYSRPFGFAPEVSDQVGYLNLASITHRKMNLTMAASAAGQLVMSAPSFNWSLLTPDGNLRMMYSIS